MAEYSEWRTKAPGDFLRRNPAEVSVIIHSVLAINSTDTAYISSHYTRLSTTPPAETVRHPQYSFPFHNSSFIIAPCHAPSTSLASAPASGHSTCIGSPGCE